MKRSLILLSLLFVLPGCVRSLHPFYIDSQLVTDPAIVGSWVDKESKMVVTLSPRPDSKEYAVEIVSREEKEKPSHLIAHVAKLGDQMIIDFLPDPKEEIGTFELAHMVPVHSFMLLKIQPNGLEVRAMNVDWYKKYMKDHPADLKFEKSDDSQDEYLLTGPTEQLQTFIISNIKTEGAYGESMLFTHAVPATQP